MILFFKRKSIEINPRVGVKIMLPDLIPFANVKKEKKKKVRKYLKIALKNREKNKKYKLY